MNEIEIGPGKRARVGYSFDDIAIVPSRRTRDPEEVSIAWQIDAYKFSLPMMAAPMDSVVSPDTAITIGKLGGLGLDGFDPEPPKHHPIFDHENVVLTPHVMGLSNQATVATYVIAAEGARDVLTGVKPKAIANLKNNQDRSTK